MALMIVALRRVAATERGRAAAERAVQRVAVVRHVDAVVGRPDEGADDGVGEEEVAVAPEWMLALMTASFTLGAMPTMPWPFASAAITPATFVPWPESSFQAAGSRFGAPPTQETLREASMLPSRSGWLASTPVSITPTSTFGLPPVSAWASGALIRCEYHWSGESGSRVDHGRVRQPAAVPVPAPAGRGGDDAADRGDAFDASGSGRAPRRSPGRRTRRSRRRSAGTRRRASRRPSARRSSRPRRPRPTRDTGRRSAPQRLDQPARAPTQPRSRARQDEWTRLAASVLSPLLVPLPDGRRGALQIGLYGQADNLHSLNRGSAPFASEARPPYVGVL